MTRFARAEGSKASNKKEYEEATSWEAMKADVEAAKKKKKKDKKKSNDAKDSSVVTQTNVTEKSNKRIVNFDSQHSDEPLKKKRKNSSSEKMSGNSVPNSDIVDQEEKNTSKKKKSKSKSLEQLKNNWVIEDGIKYKIFKDGEKKPWFDLAYEENDVMTRYNNFFVKREMVDELDQYKKSLEEEGLDIKEVTKKMLHKERKLHNKLRVELLRSEIKEKIVLESKISHKVKNKKHNEDSASKPPCNTSNTQKKEKRKDYTFTYVENEFMTQFEGYWILRENLAHIQRVSQIKYDRIIHERQDGNTDQNLTKEEELSYRRLMKKEKRREQKLLKTRLCNNNTSVPRSNTKPRNEFKPLRMETPSEDQIVKFDGYYIRKDGAERLTKLRETMVERGCTEDEIENTMKNERRKEERILKRENKLFCFKCRSTGHMISTCPESLKEGHAYDVCFKCGSAEHMARQCRVKTEESYPLATCFICNEVGHISRECPDNPKGLYPSGGCCNECGSVEHLKRDCPDLQKQREDNTIKLPRFNHGEEVEKLETDYSSSSQAVNGKKSKAKIIKFED